MVAPNGSVKLEILFDTPDLFSTAVMVSGNVAPDEEVEKIRQVAINKLWPAWAEKCPECKQAIEAIKEFQGVK